MIQKPKNQFINLCQDLMFKIFFSRNEKLLLSLVQTFIFQPKGILIWFENSCFTSGPEEGNTSGLITEIS